jgi:hypothetical protein
LRKEDAPCVIGPKEEDAVHINIKMFANVEIEGTIPEQKIVYCQ